MMTVCHFNGWADFQAYMTLGIFIGVFGICTASIILGWRHRRG